MLLSSGNASCTPPSSPTGVAELDAACGAVGHRHRGSRAHPYVTQVERRLGLDDEEEDAFNDAGHDTSSAETSPVRGSWPCALHPRPLQEEEDQGRGSLAAVWGVEGDQSGRPSYPLSTVSPAVTNAFLCATPSKMSPQPGPLQHAPLPQPPRTSFHATHTGRPSLKLGAEHGQVPCQTPEGRPTREPACEAGNERLTGGAFGLPVVPSLLYTPQVTASELAMRSSLDGELDAINTAHRMHPLPPVTTLIPGKLYVGGLPDEETVTILRQLGVHHIINCCARDYDPEPTLCQEFCVHTLTCFDDRDYLILHHDYEPLSCLLDAAFAQGEQVFVHCIAGINRSATLCAAYLMERALLSPVEVVRLFRQNGRMRILENRGFRQQLIDHYLHTVQPKMNEEEGNWN